MKVENKKINDIFFYILFFFGLFDSARNYTYLPTWVGYSKDITIFILCVINLKEIQLPIRNRFLIIVQCVYWCLWGLSGIWYSNGYPIAKIGIGIAKYMEFFLLIVLFYNWDRLFSIRIEKVIEKYVLGSCVLLFVNIFGYFIPNPIVYRGIVNSNIDGSLGFYGGRITVGQPPVVVLPMIFSCIYLLYMKENKGKKDILKIFMLIVGILISVSITGVAALLPCLIIYILHEFFIVGRRLKGKTVLCIVAVISLTVAIFKYKLQDIFSAQIEMFCNRVINYLLGKDGSMNGRYIHREFAIGTLQNKFQWLFGRGMYGFNLNGEYHHIENTYVSMICTYGILGLGMFLFFIFRNTGILIYRYWKEKKAVSLFGVCCFLIYMFHMYTLDVLIIYTMTFGFALFYAYIEKETDLN